MNDIKNISNSSFENIFDYSVYSSIGVWNTDSTVKSFPSPKSSFVSDNQKHAEHKNPSTSNNTDNRINYVSVSSSPNQSDQTLKNESSFVVSLNPNNSNNPNHSSSSLFGSFDALQLLNEAVLLLQQTSPKPILVLDFDHTMWHSCKQQLQNFDLGAVSSKSSLMLDDVTINGPLFRTKLRPGWRQFLESVSSHFEVYGYTHGTRKYAHGILNAMDPERRFFDCDTRVVCFDPDECDIPPLKSLDFLFERCNISRHVSRRVLILDDRRDVWREQDQRFVFQVTSFCDPEMFFLRNECPTEDLVNSMNLRQQYYNNEFYISECKSDETKMIIPHQTNDSSTIGKMNTKQSTESSSSSSSLSYRHSSSSACFRAPLKSCPCALNSMNNNCRLSSYWRKLLRWRPYNVIYDFVQAFNSLPKHHTTYSIVESDNIPFLVCPSSWATNPKISNQQLFLHYFGSGNIELAFPCDNAQHHPERHFSFMVPFAEFGVMLCKIRLFTFDSSDA